MSIDPYSVEDLFEDKSETSFLKGSSKKEEVESSSEKDEPLTIGIFDEEEESAEEKIMNEKMRERRRFDIDDTDFIKKEIVEAQKELKEQIKKRFDYKNLSPRLLRAMINLYQEHALLSKTPGIRSDINPNILLIPIIEQSDDKEIVVLRSPVVGSLERYQLFAEDEIVKTVREYYAQQDI